MHSRESEDCLCAGYFVIAGPQPYRSFGPGIVNREVLSISECICDRLPSLDSIEDPEKMASAFNLPQGTGQAVSKVVRTGVQDGVIAYPPVCRDRAVADRIHRLVCAHHTVKVVGFGLHRKDASRYLVQWGGAAAQPSLVSLLADERSFASDGTVLGFEPLTVCATGELGCSWLCGDVPRQLLAKTGIAPNRRGLLEDYRDADRCCRMLDAGGLDGEPGPWFAWLVCVYDTLGPRGQPL